MPPAPPDVLVHGSARWDEPWLTEHHLAAALARRGRVLYVDPPQSVLTPLKRRRHDGRVLERLVRLARPGPQLDRGVQVLRPVIAPPVSNARARRLSAPLLRRQVDAAVAGLGLAPGVVLTARELFERGAGAPGALTVVLEKDWTRAGGHLTGIGEDRVEAAQRRAWGRAGLICATSTRLRDRIAEEGFDVELLRHGFDASLAPRYEGLAAVPELAALPRPLLGCVGRIDDRWSFAALADLARAFPGGSVLLVGPLNPSTTQADLAALLALGNVHRFGAVAAAELPRWLGAMDCSLIPYRDDEWQRYASPLKIWDYLYAGRPIAATGSPAMGEFPPGLVAHAMDPAALPALVARALAEDGPALAQRRRDHARANTWDDRAARLLELVAAREA